MNEHAMTLSWTIPCLLLLPAFSQTLRHRWRKTQGLCVSFCEKAREDTLLNYALPAPSSPLSTTSCAITTESWRSMLVAIISRHSRTLSQLYSAWCLFSRFATACAITTRRIAISSATSHQQTRMDTLHATLRLLPHRAFRHLLHDQHKRTRDLAQWKSSTGAAGHSPSHTSPDLSACAPPYSATIPQEDQTFFLSAVVNRHARTLFKPCFA